RKIDPLGPSANSRRVAKGRLITHNESMFKEGQLVRVNLAGMQAGGVLFHAAVTDAIGNVVRQTSTEPSKYLVHLIFSFKGVSEVEVPEERVRAA
ncbi:MAG: hypothetical protein WBD54_05195, partial [Candidatus Acidiferrales bacterium]